MVSNLIVSKTLSRVDPIVLLQELKLIAPDIWEGNRRCLILPYRLGDIEKPEYIDHLQNVILDLYKYRDMLNTGLISEVEYERKKAEVLYDFEDKVAYSPLEIFDLKERGKLCPLI